MQGMRAGCMRGTHALSQLSPTVPEATYLSGDGASSVLESLSEAGWTLHRAAAQHNALMTLVIRNNSLIGSGSKVGENLKP